MQQSPSWSSDGLFSDQQLSATYGIPKFITVFKTAHHLTLHSEEFIVPPHNVLF
jgi:hypothetical protein